MLMYKKQEQPTHAVQTARVGEFDDDMEEFRRVAVVLSVASVVTTGVIVYGVVKVVGAIVNR